ncbi:MAG: glycosyltransferase family 4 protein [Beijerinckiaceae bacterium]|nr:glycosyltransferase family 4 protein [Beijerinckiaceae bacterium]
MTFPSTPSTSLQGATILQIIPELDAGGAERTTIDIAEGLVQAGARALVATEGGRLVAELQAKGGVWIRFPAASKNPLGMALNIGRLADILREERVAVVHARSRAPAWVAYFAARRLSLPFVTTYHGSYQARSAAKTLYNSVMARGDVVIANSIYTGELIRQNHPVSNGRIRVIYRGTDFTRFSPAAIPSDKVARMRAGWGLIAEERVVLLAARLTPWKGARVLIEAAAILKSRGLKDTIFVLAGDSQGREAYVKELDALVASSGLAGVVRRVGHVEDMPTAFFTASVVTVPSTEPEAFGRVAVEAQAIGTPVIVSNLGAVPETVLAPPAVPPEMRTGWHVAPGNAQALADGIEAALNLRPSIREAMADRARAHVEKHFSLHRMVADTLDVYAALVENPSGSI